MDQYSNQNGFLNKDGKKITVPVGDSYWSGFKVSGDYKKIPLAAYDLLSTIMVYCVCKIKQTFGAEFSNDFSDDFNT